MAAVEKFEITYILMECGGCYESAYTTPVVASTDRAKIEAHQAVLEAENAEHNVKTAAMNAAFEQWVEQNPKPNFRMANRHVIVQWSNDRTEAITRLAAEHNVGDGITLPISIRVSYEIDEVPTL